MKRRTLLGSATAATALATLPQMAFAQSRMKELIKAAKAEGELNVITLPRDWANYGAIMDTFSKKYGIKINDANPDGTSAEELQAIKSLKGQNRAPDAVDVGPSFALTGVQEKLFRPYKVETWNTIPESMKDPNGLWTGDYYGVVAFATNTNIAKTAPQTWADLKKPEYKGMVSLSGSPLGAAAAFAAVYAASLGNGGSFDDIKPGIEFFAELAKIGNFNPATAGQAMLVSGQTPIIIYWDYLCLGYRDQAVGKAPIEVTIAADAKPYGSYYCQAIPFDAPNLASAKLWQEFLYSDEGQLLFLEGYAHPVRFADLNKKGLIPASLAAKLPPAKAYEGISYPSNAQLAKAKQDLATYWPQLVKV